MSAKLRSSLRKGRAERASAEKKIAQLEGARSRLEAEVASHVSASKERQELRIVSTPRAARARDSAGISVDIAVKSM